jgi:tRNA-dihydrouridine synthase B
MRIGTLQIGDPLVLPPVSGITDRPSRIIARRFGADLAFCEFVSAEGLRRGGANSRALIDFADDEHPVGVQLFGFDPGAMAEAARIVEGIGADIVDLNFGCPARRVVGGGGGSSLLRQPELIGRIVGSVARAISIPTTVKFRLGFSRNEPPVHLEVGRICESAGASAVTLHARYRLDGFGGEAEWERITELVEELNIPVVGNGDVREPDDAIAMLRRTGCEGVAIARGALGNPWIFSRTKAFLETGVAYPPPSLDERLTVAEEHVRLQVEHRGEDVGVRQVRKHLIRYVKGLPGATAFRAEAFKHTKERQLIDCIRAYREQLAEREPESVC